MDTAKVLRDHRRKKCPRAKDSSRQWLLLTASLQSKTHHVLDPDAIFNNCLVTLVTIVLPYEFPDVKGLGLDSR
eukprot:5840249-Amphidinium_carterae.1